MVDIDAQGRIELDQVRQAIRPSTKLIAVTHASNVTGALQPVADIGRIAKDHDCLLLVDAAQTIGHVPVDVTNWGADFLAAPGHKGLLGPLGTGVLYIAPGVEQSLASVRQGGTGTQSELSLQPGELPAKYESGNLNVLGLMGLDAGVRYVLDHQLDLSKDLSALRRRLIDQLESVPRVRLFGVHPGFDTVGIVSFTVDGYDPLEVGSMLDTAGNMQVRAGLHCAPEMHRALGTLALGGTVRISCGHFNSVEEIDRVVNLVQTMASSVTHEGL